MSTIAAIATATGSSGISIIRISGNQSLKLISKIFNNYKKLKSNTIHYGKIIDGNNVIDTVLVSYFESPNSYTGEDVVEINCHGGIFITNKILDIVIKNGARLAEAGEFSKRAFLNGKMDLSEAEAVIDLINSKTDLEAKIASSQLNGHLRYSIENLREKMIDILAHIDVNVDYPEYDYENLEKDNILNFLNNIIEDISKLLNTYEQGKYIKNGINVAILGRPNAGKSSLLNSLANKQRAIVTDIEGTTRDIITESINIGDLILNINDTAGIRKTEDKIEKIGVTKSIEILDEVDLILYIFDPSKNIDDEEKEILSKIKNKGLKTIYLINKTDIYQKDIFDTFMTQIDDIDKNSVIKISAKEGTGTQALKDKIKQMFLIDNLNTINDNIIVNERHKMLINDCYNMLLKAKDECEKDIPVDMISISIKEAAKSLGKIIGKDVSLDVASRIFEKFCIGK